MSPLTERRRRQLQERTANPAVQYWGVADGESEGSRGGFFMPGQGYNGAECAAVLMWMYERRDGYPSLKRFEGGKCWPSGHGLPCPACEGGVGLHAKRREERG